MQNTPFSRLIGKWKTAGTVNIDGTDLPLVGNESFEYVVDGNFILHKVDVMIGPNRNQTIEMISAGNEENHTLFQYFNSKKEIGLLNGYIKDHSFIVENEHLRFDGSFNASDTEIA